MVALRTMFLQVLDLPKLWKISKWDFSIWIVTFLSTVLLDVPYGLLVSGNGLNKAGYMATQVACRWVGAVIMKDN